MGGGVWNGRGCLEKNYTVMNENSGIWENSCDRIKLYEWCYIFYTIHCCQGSGAIATRKLCHLKCQSLF